MIDAGSNQRPRLPWRRNPAGHRAQSYIAYPFGDGLAPYATIDDSNGNPALGWRWRAAWPGRFVETDLAASKQEAADAATIAFWEAIERTSDWPWLPEPIVPPLAGALADFNDEQLKALQRQFLKALAYGNVPSIEATQGRDQQVYDAIFQEWRRRAATSHG